jgi:hypothetical protein
MGYWGKPTLRKCQFYKHLFFNDMKSLRSRMTVRNRTLNVRIPAKYSFTPNGKQAAFPDLFRSPAPA